MVAEALESFLTADFLRAATNELERSGFVTDEHRFAPYRDTLVKHRDEIQRALEASGHAYSLSSGFTKDHPQAGYAHYIYDMKRFPEANRAEHAVREWLDEKYATAES